MLRKKGTRTIRYGALGGTSGEGAGGGGEDEGGVVGGGTSVGEEGMMVWQGW